MDLRQLRYFLAVAEEGHFGRAASRLHIVQPALSMQIRVLEETLGALLFKRTTRRVELTEAGALLRVEAERMIAQAEHAKLVVQRSARGEIGSIRIGFVGTAAYAGVLARDLRSFRARHPKVEIEFRDIAWPFLPDEIVAGRLDLGYSPAWRRTFDRRLTVDPVGSWPWIVAMNRDHPLAVNETLSARSLRNESFIVCAANSTDVDHLEGVRRALGREPRVAHRVANGLAALTLVAGGLGLTLVSEPFSEVRIPGITYRPLAGFRHPFRMVLLSRSGETSGAVNAFLKVVRAQSAERRGGG
jgi:DNA-binding transcriptional LysR family regulator